MKSPIIVSCSLLAALLSSCYDCRSSFEEYKNDAYGYRIIEKFISKNHAMPTLIVINYKNKRRKLGLLHLRDLYQNAAVGDSVSKEKGSLEFKLYKPDTVMSFYPECDGVKIR